MFTKVSKAGLILSVLCSTAMAQTKYEYPELLVTPLASQRLISESKSENKGKWLTHLNTQAPALLNLFNGLRLMGEKPKESSSLEDYQDKEVELNNAALVSTTIGAGWLGLTVGLSAMYSPYKAKFKEVKRMPAKTKRQQLARERRAEEIIQEAASFGRTLHYAGAATNILAASMVSSQTNDAQTQIQAGIALLLSFTPLLFDHPWQEPYRRHQDYKKRIYAPVVKMEYTPSLRLGELAPSMSLTWDF